MIGFVKCFDSNKTMSIKVSGKKLLQKCNKIWGKIGSLMNKKISYEPLYGHNDEYRKTKKSHMEVR